MNIDKETRESRGSVSYTDYYSNEDGQIRRSADNCYPLFLKTTALGAPSEDSAATSAGSVEDEDNTLTLKQAEEQKKQDVQQIFEEKQMVKPGSSYKKIGRWGDLLIWFCQKIMN